MKDDETDRLTAAIVAKFRRRREELGLSVNKLAEMAGVSHVAILKLESGDRTPMLRTTVKIADALNLRLSAIFAELGL